MANRLNNEESKKWNKTQADTLRRLADQVEQGDYESLNLNTVVDYFHFVTQREALPQRMKVYFELTYVEGEITHATAAGTFGEKKKKVACTCEYPYDVPGVGHHPNCDISVAEVEKIDG